MINVLSVVSELKLGGGENRVLNLARAIDRSRFRHTVVTLYAPNPHESRFRGSLRQLFQDEGIPLLELGVAHPGTLALPRMAKVPLTAARLAEAVTRLRRLILSSGADLVDAHLETSLYTAVPAAVLAGVPCTMTLYSELSIWPMVDRGLRRKVLPSVRRLSLRGCRAILTDSNDRAEDFRRFVGSGAPPAYVIPNGVRLASSPRPRKEVLRMLGIAPSPGATVIGQVAGLVPYKGQALLVRAAKEVLQRGHDVWLLCIGEERLGATYPNELRRLAEALGVSHRVVIGSYPGDIADVWNAIDLHVHASTLDSFPNAVIEGMAAGKPAVVSAVGAIPEHVDHQRTGLVIAPGDLSALIAALDRLLTHPDEGRKLGEAAHRRYLERFTPEVTARRMETVFEQVVRGAV